MNDYYHFNFTKVFSNGSVKAIEKDDNAELILKIVADNEKYAYNCGIFNVRSNKDRDFSLNIYAK
jgi:hypothetical protein